MAEQCGLGRSRFSHYCRRITNLSPIQYLQKCRVDNAKALLAGDSGSITHIAMRCGFDSSQYFATVFHRLTGLSPSAYRRIDRRV
jgi:AraC family L-rhamnose operon regulatory protein RhaS